VVCVYFLLSVCLSVFRVPLFLCSTPSVQTTLSIPICIYVPIAVHKALPICLYFSSIYIFISLLMTCVCALTAYTHFPPSSHTFMFPSKSTAMYHTLVTYSCPFIGASFSICIYIFHLISMYVCSSYPILATYNETRGKNCENAFLLRVASVAKRKCDL